MYLSLRRSTQKRRGVILLIVLMMLVLFAIVGITFVLMADTRSTEARIFREHENTYVDPNISATPANDGGSQVPDLQLAYFLNRLIYDDANDTYGVADSMRGWSLSRGMYGAQPGNLAAYNGVGRLHNPVNAAFTDPVTGNAQVDLFNLLNYQYFASANDGLGIRDPEYTAMRANLNTSPSGLVGQNAPYTYPDMNNAFLGSMNSDGTIVMRSFFRDYLFGSLAQTNKHWTDAVGKYLTLRPRPIDMGPGFPYPADLGGDVKNVDGPGYYDPIGKQYYNNDSVWMDINYAIQQNSLGQWYKPLFAPFIVDLDGLANVNVDGNIRNQGSSPPRHASNQGFAPTEVNLEKVLTNPTVPFEVAKLFTGTSTVAGRYGSWDGTSALPVPLGSTPSNQAGGSNTPHFYANVDVDGGENAQTSNPIVTGPAKPVLLPGAQGFPTLPSSTVPQFLAFPSFPANTYLNGNLFNSLEQKNHPILFNPFSPNGNNSAFPVSEMEALLRYGQLNVPSSRILQLLPTTLTNDLNDPMCALRRRMITTHSFDVDKAGITPWIFSSDTTVNGDYKLTYTAGGANNNGYTNGYTPQGKATNFPTLQQLQSGAMEFALNDGRARDASLGRVDINRPLPSYPTPDSTTGAFKQTDIKQYQAAVQARQKLAKEVFDRLRSVTTGNTRTDPYPTVGTPEYEALRWLAQLAVNIVDFVNSDEYSTPFNWDPKNTKAATVTGDTSATGGWVFGTKLPRVVLNEAYAEYVNTPTQKALQTVSQYNVNLWVELHNPTVTDSTQNDGKNGSVQLQATDPKSNQPYPIYTLDFTQKNSNLWDPTNVLGYRDADGTSSQSFGQVNAFTPDANGITGGVVNSACNDSTLIQPANGTFGLTTSDASYNGNNKGFYVLGPIAPSDPKNKTALAFPGTATDTRPMPQSTFATPQMTYQFTVNNGNNPSNQPPSILLRRLACPAMPPDNTPGSATYNPYITVDFMENVPVFDASTLTGAGLPNVPTVITSRYSVGKMEPYASAPLGLLPQNNLSKLYPDRPQQTLFHHNSIVDDPTTATTWPATGDNLTVPFHWLSQLNRTVISPIELRQVSAFKPHLLTQAFVSYAASSSGPPTPTAYQHIAKWFNANNRIYRFFEFVEDHDRMAGSVKGGRYPGRVNANTLRDLETFRALCDAQPSNYFYVPSSTVSGSAFAGGTNLTVSAFSDSAKQTTWKVLPGDMIQLNTGQPTAETVFVQSATLSNNIWSISTVTPLQNAHKSAEPATLDLVARFYCRMIAARENPLGPNFASDTNYPALAATIATRENPPGMWYAAGTPFQGYSAGNIPSGDSQYPNGYGVNNTILRMADPSGKTQGRLFEVPDAPFYYRTELMTKLHDRLTTRSHVFAVWVTVGYFQVTNVNQLSKGQTQNGFGLPPIQLGAEMTDPVSGQVTRHKMFAIVDRSALTFLTGSINSVGPAPVFIYGQNTDQTTLVPSTLEVDALSGTFEGGPSQGGANWSITTGTQLTLDEGRDNEETVKVISTGTSSTSGKPTISIKATKAHALVMAISFADRHLGNPGPQLPGFDPRTVGGVVKYYRLVQ